jgi:hypothetical protein
VGGEVVLGREPTYVADLAEQLGGQHGPAPSSSTRVVLDWAAAAVMRAWTAAIRQSRWPMSLMRSVASCQRVTAGPPAGVTAANSAAARLAVRLQPVSQTSGGQEAPSPLVTLSERSWCTLGGWSTVTAEPTVLVIVDGIEGRHVAMRSRRPATWAPWRGDADAKGRLAVRVAWATLATYWGLAGASLLLRTINDPTAGVSDAVLTRLGWGAYPTVGAVIVARRPRNPVGWLCCAVGLLLGPAFFGQDYAWYALVHEPGSLPGGQAMAWLGQWPWRIVLGLLAFLLLLFPSGQLVSARWRPVAWAAAAGTVLLGLWAAFAPQPLEGAGLEGMTNPLGIHGAEAAFKVLQAAAAVLLVATILAAASMVVRFRRARSEERQQLKWFTYAAVLSVAVWLVFIVTGLVDRLPLALGIVIALAWLVAVPAAIGVAMLRYRLYDIDKLINRTVVMGCSPRCSAASTPAWCWRWARCSAAPRVWRWRSRH